MDHKVKDVQELYNSSTNLYDNVVVKGDASAETMLEDLNSAITNLKENWKGADAGINIEQVIKIHNTLVKVRNDLAGLACDASKVAAHYREIQINNQATFLPTLEGLTYTEKNNMEDYEDTADTIDINPEADAGRRDIEAVVNSIDTFISSVQKAHKEILDNWTQGTGRNQADESFTEFINNSQVYKKELTDVATSIANALKNYSF
jgi:uncharacterized protein YukE